MRVGVVAEQHRARAAHLDHDLRQPADLAVADHPARLDELREPASGVVDVHRHARRPDGGHDRVGVLERRGDRLLAEDPARAGLDGDLDHAAMEMVRGDHRRRTRGARSAASRRSRRTPSAPGSDPTSARGTCRGPSPRCRSRRPARARGWPPRPTRGCTGWRCRGSSPTPAPARSAEIQLRPTSAMRRVIEPPAASPDPTGFPTVVSPLILPHRSPPRQPADGQSRAPGPCEFR